MMHVTKTIWFIPAVMTALGIFALSTFFSVPIQVEGISYLDKWQHLFAYFVLSLSFLFAFSKSGSLTKRKATRLLLSCAAYGLSLEFTQFFLFPDRFFEWIDAIANTLGVLLGYAVFSWLFNHE